MNITKTFNKYRKKVSRTMTTRYSKKQVDGLIKDFNRIFEIANRPRRCKFCNEYGHQNYVCNNCWQDDNDDYKQILNKNLLYHLPDKIDYTLFKDIDKKRAVNIMRKKRISLTDALTEIYELKYKKE